MESRINVLAAINSVSYGIVGLNVCLALERLGHAPALWPISGVEADSHHQTLRTMMARTQFYNRLAPSLRIWHQFALAEHVGKGLHCAYPFFELTRLNKTETHHLLNQDIVFVPSHWAGEVLVNNGIPEERIQYAPLGVDTSIFSPTQSEQSDETVFVNIGKFEYRKGHDVLIEAFEKAFAPTDNVRLVMNCINPCFSTKEKMDRYNEQWLSLYENSPMSEKVSLYEDRLPDQYSVARLMDKADCGVFPSRAEGWNLEAAEMLAMGKHVILTNYSAHTEFANESNSHLIHVDKLEDAHDGIWFDANRPDWEGRPGQWAEMGEGQIDQLVEHMRRIHRLKQDGQLKLNKAGQEQMKGFSWDNAAREIASVLN